MLRVSGDEICKGRLLLERGCVGGGREVQGARAEAYCVHAQSWIQALDVRGLSRETAMERELGNDGENHHQPRSVLHLRCTLSNV